MDTHPHIDSFIGGLYIQGVNPCPPLSSQRNLSVVKRETSREMTTPEQWRDALRPLGIELRKEGATRWVGPCINCGEGDDRFYVNTKAPFKFWCRQCEDTKAIWSAVFGRSDNGSTGRRSIQDSSSYLDAEYVTADGKRTRAYRRDYAAGEPCGSPTCKKSGQAHKHCWKDRDAPHKGLLLTLYPPDQSDLIDDVIVICEGPRKARAVRDAGYVGASYYGGTGYAGLADYSPVFGKSVVIWADSDNPGRQAAVTVAKECFHAQANPVWTMEATPGEETGKDAADYPVEQVQEMIAAALASQPMTEPTVDEGVREAPDRGDTIITFSGDGLRKILGHLKLEVRLNSRIMRMEIRRVGSEAESEQWAAQWGSPVHPGGWVTLDKNIHADIIEVSKQRYRVLSDRGLKVAAWTDRDLDHALLVNAPRPPTDPFKEWLEALPEWDGDERIRELWCITMGMPDTELNHEAGRRFLIGAVRRTYEPGCVHDWLPVLVGPQGLGKSSILRELVAPASEWYSDGTQLDGTPKEKLETTGPCVINEFADMGGLDRSDQAKLKAWFTRLWDQLRPAWERYAMHLPRKWVGVGTANPDPAGVLPGDSTGSRRYVIMTTEFDGELNHLAKYAADGRAWVRNNLVQLWAEALSEYHRSRDAGDTAMNLIPGHLRAEQERIAIPQQRQNQGMQELALDLSDYARNYWGKHRVGPTLRELMVEARLSEDEPAAALDNAGQQALANALTTLGWTNTRVTHKGQKKTRWFAGYPEGHALFKSDAAGVVCAQCGGPPTGSELSATGLCGKCLVDGVTTP